MAEQLQQSHTDVAWEYLVKKQNVLKECTKLGGDHPMYAEKMSEWRRLRDLQCRHEALASLENAPRQCL